jgi:hypothetical protein
MDYAFFLSAILVFRPIIIGLALYVVLYLICGSFRSIAGSLYLSPIENWLSSRRGVGTICVLSGAWLINFSFTYQHLLWILLAIILLVISFLIANSLYE